MKHTFQFSRSQNIFWVFSDTLYERQRRRWSAIHGAFSSNLGKSDQPIHQPIRTPDSGETSSQLETSNRRECEKCSLKKINQFILCLAIAFVEILSRMNCLIWPKIVILQLFSLVSSQMCSLKTTCQNRFKFPYDHCFHICNLYLMETGTQCFKEETSNGERAVAKCLQKLSWHDGILLVLSSLGVVASWAVLFLPAERWTITGLSLHRLLFCFSGTLFHRPNCVLIIQSCDSSPVVLERLQKILLANVKAMAISEF